MTYIYIILTAVVCFYLGYQFAKARYMVKEMMGMLKILSDYISGEIPIEKAREEIEKLYPDTKIGTVTKSKPLSYTNIYADINKISEN